MVDMSNIVFKSKNAVVINKPAGIPSQKDTSGDKDALTLLSEELRRDSDRDELYLVHRLDRVVGGLMVFARSRSSAAELSKAAADGELGKEYFAIAKGKVEGGVFVDYLCKNSTLGKSLVTDKNKIGAKRAELECLVLDTVSTDKGAISLLRITLKTGRFHQIRAQLSSRGHALVGDTKYGGADSVARAPALFSCKLDFSVSGEKTSVTAAPNVNEYPWSLFAPEKYEV